MVSYVIELVLFQIHFGKLFNLGIAISAYQYVKVQLLLLQYAILPHAYPSSSVLADIHVAEAFFMSPLVCFLYLFLDD